MLLFAIIVFSLGLWTAFGLGSWANAGLWLSLGVFLSCFSAILGDRLVRLHRLLLVIGLIAGIVAFGFALRMSGLLP